MRTFSPEVQHRRCGRRDVRADYIGANGLSPMRSARRECRANPAGLIGLEGHDIEPARRPGRLTESAQQIELRCTGDPLLLAPSDACGCAPKTRLATGSDFNEHPFDAILHDEVDLARLESHIAIDRAQPVTTQKLECTPLGVETTCLQWGRHGADTVR